MLPATSRPLLPPASPPPQIESRYESYLSVSRLLYADQSLAGSRRSSSNCGTNAATLRDAQPNPTFGVPPPREAVPVPDTASCSEGGGSGPPGGRRCSSDYGGTNARVGRVSGGKASISAKGGASAEGASREPFAQRDAATPDALLAAAACNALAARAAGVEPPHLRPPPALTASVLAGEGDILISKPLSAVRFEGAALVTNVPQCVGASSSSVGANVGAILAHNDFLCRAFSASRNRLQARPQFSAAQQRTATQPGMPHTQTDRTRGALHMGNASRAPAPQRALGIVTAEQPACRISGLRDPLLVGPSDGLAPHPTRCARVPGVVSVGPPWAASSPLQPTHDRQQPQPKPSSDSLHIWSTAAPRHEQTRIASTIAVALVAQQALRKARAARTGVDQQTSGVL